MSGTGFRHIHLAATPSTNLEVLERARAGDGGRLWITADQQLQGKGSRGRGWESPVGNLYASLLLIDSAPVTALSQLAFVASLAVRAAIEKCGDGSRPVQIKWPNDVLIGGAKCSGILLESHEVKYGGNSRRAAIIGCGINCGYHPSGTAFPATSLANEQFHSEPMFLFPHLQSQFAHYLQLWKKGEGFSDIREEWLSHAANLGQEIKVVLPNGDVLVGKFEHLDEQGRLILGSDAGRKNPISVADLFFENEPEKKKEQ